MVISLIAPSRFHHIDLAKQLAQRGVLGHLFTGYPAHLLADDRLPADKIKSFPYFRALQALNAKYIRGDETPLLRKLKYLSACTLPMYASWQLNEADVLIAIAASGLEAGRVIRQDGRLWVCDRPCTHILTQNELLVEEHKIWGQTDSPIDPKIIDRELQEYEECDYVFVPSEFSKQTFLERGASPDKIVKVPYGVSLEEFYPLPKEPTDKLRVLFVGAVTLRKGFLYLLQAVNQIKGDNVELIAIGSMGPSMRKLVKKVGDSRATFLGPQKRAAIQFWMSQADVLVLPSVEDGFGLVLAEAMACGCPVITTTNSAAFDIVDQGVQGIVVPPRDVTALKDAIESIVCDPDRRQEMSEASLKKVEGLMGWHSYGDTVVEAVCDIMSRKQLGRQQPY